MSALMISRITIKDQEKFQEYLVRTKELASKFGAELVFSGPVSRMLADDTKHDLVVVARFPSIAKANEWYDSDEYKPLIALRKEGAHMEMTSYESA